jgi:hypothetical protein
MKPPIGASDYYETFPSADHQAGDIWAQLPTHGTLTAIYLPCVVITPACDLMNRKVETVTYLPIVPVASYLASRSYMQEILRAVEGQLHAAGLALKLRNDKSLPRVDDLETAGALLTERKSKSRLSAREESAATRAESGLFSALKILEGADADSISANLKILFGDKEFGETVRRLVTNSHRADVHFLPPDGQSSQWSVIRQPSLALFRYPLSLPIDILDIAGTVPEEAWSCEVARLKGLYPCTLSLGTKRPLKVLRIRPRFLSDMLTRFTGLYGRIGSPDFSDGAIDHYVDQIGG